jgi:hypothetical protein
MADFFPTWRMRPNPACTDRCCRERQAQYKGWISPEDAADAAGEQEVEVVHDDNEWDICCTGASEDEEEEVTAESQAGLSFGFQPVKAVEPEEHAVPEADLGDMMKQFMGAQGLPDVVDAPAEVKPVVAAPVVVKVEAPFPAKKRFGTALLKAARSGALEKIVDTMAEDEAPAAAPVETPVKVEPVEVAPVVAPVVDEPVAAEPVVKAEPVAMAVAMAVAMPVTSPSPKLKKKSRRAD